MQITPTKIPDVLIIEPKVFGDERGFFFESFNSQRFKEKTGLNLNFVQDNHSKSSQNVLRGLHYQIKQPQGKLMRVIFGEILDVAVDIRKDSPTFGKWISEVLSGDNKKQIFVPEGFAHGFLVKSESAEVLYKTTDFYAPEHERCIIWNDPDININWDLNTEPILSPKDQQGTLLKDADIFQ